MKYIFPKFNLRKAIVIVFSVFVFIQIYSTEKDYFDLGQHEIANTGKKQQISLNIQEIDYLKITIEEHYKDLSLIHI